MLSLIVRLLLLPFRLVVAVLRVLMRPIGVIVNPIVARIDSSSSLSTFINRLSSSMATQRGLLLIVGTATMAVSLLAHALVLLIMVSTGSFDRNLYWLCIPFVLSHLGVLIGFTGAMLATPLGQGYKDEQQ